MDGSMVIVISTVSSLVVIGSGFLKLGKDIGYIKGKVDGLVEDRTSLNDRLDRLDRRINGIKGIKEE